MLGLPQHLNHLISWQRKCFANHIHIVCMTLLNNDKVTHTHTHTFVNYLIYWQCDDTGHQWKNAAVASWRLMISTFSYRYKIFMPTDAFKTSGGTSLSLSFQWTSLSFAVCLFFFFAMGLLAELWLMNCETHQCVCQRTNRLAANGGVFISHPHMLLPEAKENRATAALLTRSVELHRAKWIPNLSVRLQQINDDSGFYFQKTHGWVQKSRVIFGFH